MKTARETVEILNTLEGQHPNADTELHYRTPFELLVATILSAQSTDAGVNQVTPALFARYPNAAALAQAATEDLEPQIHSTGFFRAKSRALIGMAKALVAEHGGDVPAAMDALTALPGVGRKTANVVLGHALGIPGLPVDRHVLRVSNRLGIAEGDDAEKVEEQLCKALPKERWTRTSDTLILHGRRICKPKPLCDECAAQSQCDFFLAVSREAEAAPTVTPKRAATSPRMSAGQPEKTKRPRTVATAGKHIAPKAPTDVRTVTTTTGRSAAAKPARAKAPSTSRKRR